MFVKCLLVLAMNIEFLRNAVVNVNYRYAVVNVNFFLAEYLKQTFFNRYALQIYQNMFLYSLKYFLNCNDNAYTIKQLFHRSFFHEMILYQFHRF